MDGSETIVDVEVETDGGVDDTSTAKSWGTGWGGGILPTANKPLI